MSERFTRLFSLPSDLYAEGSPVIIAAGALLKDNQTGKVLAQLKLKNIGPKAIKAVKVKIAPLDTVNKPLDGEKVYEYLDLDVQRDGEFGQKAPIYLSDARTRAFEAEVAEVDFADNSVWTASGAAWASLEAVKPFDGDPELIKQYKTRFGDKAKYALSEQKGLWTCACGAVNLAGEASCHECGLSLNALRGLDLAELSAEMNERLAKEKALEEQLRAEEEKKKVAAKAKAKKTGKILAIVIPAAIIVAAAIVILTKVIIPNSNYNKALALLNAGQYDEAVAAFSALGNYRDSEQKITETKTAKIEAQNTSDYNAAVELLRSGQYDDAKEAFLQLGNFLNSKEMAEEAEAEKKEAENQAAYAAAEDLLAGEDYDGAIIAFSEIADYRDSQQRVEEAMEGKNRQIYNQHMEQYLSKEYAEAYLGFMQLGDYNDSRDMAYSVANEYATVLRSEDKYKEAYEWFDKGKNQDAANEVAVEYASLLNEQGDIDLAIKWYEVGKDADSADATRYEYVNSHLDRADLKTYSYLKELVDHGYKGAQETYDTLYAVNLRILVNLALDNLTYSQTYVAMPYRNHPYYIHIFYTGGPPEMDVLSIEPSLTYSYNGKTREYSLGSDRGHWYVDGKNYQPVNELQRDKWTTIYIGHSFEGDTRSLLAKLIINSEDGLTEYANVSFNLSY